MERERESGRDRESEIEISFHYPDLVLISGQKGRGARKVPVVGALLQEMLV